MKKRILTVFVLMAMGTVATFAQGIGVRAGFNLQNITGEAEGEDLENTLKPGFNVGAFYEISVAPDFYFQPNLLFNMKGAKNKDEDSNFSLGYVELPLHFLYKPQLGSGRIIVGFGPYLAYGVTGKIKTDNETIDVKFKNDLSEDEALEIVYGETFYMKGFDAGADVFFGYEFPFQVSVQFNAQLGLLNLMPKFEGETVDDTSLKNVGFGLSVGYRF